MKNWLRTKYDKLVHKTKLWVYKWCLLVLKKLRIYHTADIIAKANSKEGFWWNDRLLLSVNSAQGNLYTVVYCVPGVSVNSATVDMDDLITGTAELPLYRSRNIETTIQYVKERERGQFWGGIQKIGTIGFPSPEEPTEKICRTTRECNALMQEIWMEYQAKLKAEEPRKDG